MKFRSYITAVSVILAIACEQKEPQSTVNTRTEADQQVRKLREDNETEFKDLRGRWLAAEAQLIQLKTLFEEANGTSKTERNALRESIQLLETEMMSMRTAIGGVSVGGVSSVVTIPERERLRRSAEEIICLRRRQADEQVTSVYGRYGFADEAEWSAAWLRYATNSNFEAELFVRLKSLCPRYNDM
ncbi:MAG: hypothetical protein VX223_05805 [Myxococcota bacterium]|nr:hypothetical protein [Myxococcota bacterium]